MWIPTRENRRLAAGLVEIRTAVTDLIAARRAIPAVGGREDMLGLLLAARDGENVKDRLTATEVADQVLIFMLAGHDTTATTLACLLVELARQPHWQKLVQDELDEVVGPGSPTVKHLGQLSWTRRVVREGLRLYPAAHSLDRSSPQDEVIGGYHIPAGMPVIISPWALHRSPDVWTDPETFDPLRFEAGTGQPLAVHKYAWIPFGAGPHACIAAQLVMVEVPLVLATLVKAFRATTSLPTTPLLAAMTVRPAGPLPIRVQER
jgi:cytochrome P450